MSKYSADRAVARGIRWLDAHIRGWRKRIDLYNLDLGYPCQCVLGQLEGNFYEAVWARHMTLDEVHARGFSAPKGVAFSTLTAAWKRALREPA